MSRIVHQIAYCLECKNFENARKKGYAHAKATGHIVTWETGTAGNYHFPNSK